MGSGREDNTRDSRHGLTPTGPPLSSTLGESPNRPLLNGHGPSPAIDGVALASLLVSLTCFGAPLGLVLGVIGLVRTRGGARKGRWAALTGTIVGLLVTLVPLIFLYDLFTDPRPFNHMQ